MAIAFANAAGVWVVGPAGDGQAFGPPQQIGAAGWRADPSIDITVNGVGYLVWSQDGDVRSAYLSRTAPAFAAHPTRARPRPGARRRHRAGAEAPRHRVGGRHRPRRWGERDAPGMTHVIVRRLVRDRVVRRRRRGERARPSTVSRRGSADTPDIAFEDDSSYAWVVFRQQAIDASAAARRCARSRAACAARPSTTRRRSTAAPRWARTRCRAIGAERARAGHRDRRGAGQPRSPRSSRTTRSRPRARRHRVDRAGSLPVAGFARELRRRRRLAPALGDRSAVEVARAPPGGRHRARAAAAVRTRRAAVRSGARTGRRAAAGLDADVTRAGDAAIAFVQENADGRRLVVAVYDRGAGRAGTGTTSTGWRRATPAGARLGRGVRPLGRHHLLGHARRPAGRHDHRQTGFTLPAPIVDGIHRWQVIATDRRGQVTRGDDAQPADRRDAAEAVHQDRRQAPDRQAADLLRRARSICAPPPARASSRCGSTTATARSPVVTTTERPIFGHAYFRQGHLQRPHQRARTSPATTSSPTARS